VAPIIREVSRDGVLWEALVVGSSQAPGGVPLLELEFSRGEGRPLRGLIPGEDLAEIEQDELLGLLEAALQREP